MISLAKHKQWKQGEIASLGPAKSNKICLPAPLQQHTLACFFNPHKCQTLSIEKSTVFTVPFFVFTAGQS